MIFTKKISEFKSLVNKYGEPVHSGIEGEPLINGFGIAVFPNGEQFVKEARTGQIIKRTRNVRYLGHSNGLHYYISEEKKLRKTDEIKYPSFPKEVIES